MYNVNFFVIKNYPNDPFCCQFDSLIFSQCVDKTEVGRIFSSLSLLSALVPFMSGPLFAAVYDTSLSHFSGMFMIVTCIIIILALLLMLVVRHIMKGRNVERDIKRAYSIVTGLEPAIPRSEVWCLIH